MHWSMDRYGSYGFPAGSTHTPTRSPRCSARSSGSDITATVIGTKWYQQRQSKSTIQAQLGSIRHIHYRTRSRFLDGEQI